MTKYEEHVLRRYAYEDITLPQITGFPKAFMFGRYFKAMTKYYREVKMKGKQRSFDLLLSYIVIEELSK